MPNRVATLNHQIHRNGARLHQAMLSRIHSHGAEPVVSEQEQALIEERRQLKEAQAARRTASALPKARPVKAVKPPRSPKAAKAPKPPKEPKAAKAAKPAKDHLSRADKVAAKAQSLEAARKAAKKSAKT